MKYIVTKAAVIACLLSPMLASATSTTSTATTLLNLKNLSNVTVGYSWEDYFVATKNKPNDEVNAKSLGWTFTGPVGFTAQSASFSDPTGTPSGSGEISFTNLSAGSYTLELVGRWEHPNASSDAVVTTIGLVSLDTPKIAAVSPVPEPESYAMLLAGLGLMGTIARRRNKDKAA